jgi:LPS-assembly lipoprotein
MKKLLIPLFLSLLLSACGFHLRGMIHIPAWLNNIAIISKNDDKQLISILQTQLEGYNVHVNPDDALATYWLVINQVVINRQIISIGASTNPRQYNLVLSINYMLETRKGKIIKTPRTVSVARQLTVNNDRILGSTDEEDILIGEMKHDAVVQIINQLSHRDEAQPLS